MGGGVKEKKGSGSHLCAFEDLNIYNRSFGVCLSQSVRRERLSPHVRTLSLSIKSRRTDPIQTFHEIPPPSTAQAGQGISAIHQWGGERKGTPVFIIQLKLPLGGSQFTTSLSQLLCCTEEETGTSPTGASVHRRALRSGRDGRTWFLVQRTNTCALCPAVTVSNMDTGDESRPSLYPIESSAGVGRGQYRTRPHGACLHPRSALFERSLTLIGIGSMPPTSWR